MKITASLIDFKSCPEEDRYKLALPFFPKCKEFFIKARLQKPESGDWIEFPLKPAAGGERVYLDPNSAAQVLGVEPQDVRAWHEKRSFFEEAAYVARKTAALQLPDALATEKIRSILQSRCMPDRICDGDIEASCGKDGKIVLVNRKTRACWDLYRRQSAVDWRGKVDGKTVQILPDGRRFVHIKKPGERYAHGRWKVCKYAEEEGKKSVARLITRLDMAKEPRVLREHLKGLWILERLQGKGIVETYGSVRAVNKRGEKQLVSYQRHYQYGSLLNYLHNQGAVPAENRNRIALSLLEAMDRMHKQKIYHRDLKEENILIDTSQERTGLLDAAICDFDLSWIEGSRASEICGTPIAFSPEKAAASVDRRAIEEKDLEKQDVWAMGLILYSIYHGKPMEALNVESREEAMLILSNVSNDRGSIFLPTIFPIDNLIYEMLQIQPRDRIGSAEALSTFRKMIQEAK